MVVDHSSWQIQAIRLARFSFPHVYHNLARTVYYNIAIFLPPVLVRKTCPLFSRLFVRSNELEIEHTNWPRVWHVCGRFIRMYHYSLNMYIYMYFFLLFFSNFHKRYIRKQFVELTIPLQFSCRGVQDKDMNQRRKECMMRENEWFEWNAFVLIIVFHRYLYYLSRTWEKWLMT